MYGWSAFKELQDEHSSPDAPRCLRKPSHVDHSLGFSTHHLWTANSGPPLTGRLCKLLPLPPACPLSNK
ncbi:hypothetical protein AMECASPLE_009332 [Ameca splendens]|uniref:Uncharacterized protein n=1 Tax=Ameca splendens TaxID=208324 RepID=A0ABV0Y061_9TELE